MLKPDPNHNLREQHLFAATPYYGHSGKSLAQPLEHAETTIDQFLCAQMIIDQALSLKELRSQTIKERIAKYFEKIFLGGAI